MTQGLNNSNNQFPCCSMPGTTDTLPTTLKGALFTIWPAPDSSPEYQLQTLLLRTIPDTHCLRSVFLEAAMGVLKQAIYLRSDFHEKVRKAGKMGL